MKKLLFISAIILLASTISCQRYIAKHKSEICETCPDKIIERHDSIVIQKIDTVYKVATVDTLSIVTAAIAGLPENFNTDTVFFRDKTFETRLWIENSKLRAEIKHYNDTIDKIIVENSTIVNNNDMKSKTSTKTVVKKAGRFYVWFFWIVAVLAVLFIVAKLFLRKYVKWLDDLFDINERQ